MRLPAENTDLVVQIKGTSRRWARIVLCGNTVPRRTKSWTRCFEDECAVAVGCPVRPQFPGRRKLMAERDDSTAMSPESMAGGAEPATGGVPVDCAGVTSCGNLNATLLLSD